MKVIKFSDFMDGNYNSDEDKNVEIIKTILLFLALLATGIEIGKVMQLIYIGFENPFM